MYSICLTDKMFDICIGKKVYYEAFKVLGFGEGFVGKLLIHFLANSFLYFFKSNWLILGHIFKKMFGSSQYAILARYLICLFEKCLIWSFIKSRNLTRVLWQIVLKTFWETVLYIFSKVINLSLVFFVIWSLVQVNSLYWEEV